MALFLLFLKALSKDNLQLMLLDRTVDERAAAARQYNPFPKISNKLTYLIYVEIVKAHIDRNECCRHFTSAMIRHFKAAVAVAVA